MAIAEGCNPERIRAAINASPIVPAPMMPTLEMPL
jgi:hypothetical protein